MNAYGPSRPTGRPFAVTRLDAAIAPDHHVVETMSGDGVHWRCACGFESPAPWTGWRTAKHRNHNDAEVAWKAHLDAQIPPIHWRNEADRRNAEHILISSLTGYFPLTLRRAASVVIGWSDEEVGAFVTYHLGPNRDRVPGAMGWDFEVAQ